MAKYSFFQMQQIIIILYDQKNKIKKQNFICKPTFINFNSFLVSLYIGNPICTYYVSSSLHLFIHVFFFLCLLAGHRYASQPIEDGECDDSSCYIYILLVLLVCWEMWDVGMVQSNQISQELGPLIWLSRANITCMHSSQYFLHDDLTFGVAYILVRTYISYRHMKDFLLEMFIMLCQQIVNIQSAY